MRAQGRGSFQPDHAPGLGFRAWWLVAQASVCSPLGSVAVDGKVWWFVVFIARMLQVQTRTDVNLLNILAPPRKVGSPSGLCKVNYS